MAQKFISLEEAAEQLGISKDRLTQLREAGKVRAYRDGSSWKFRSEDIDKLAAEGIPQLDPGASDLSARRRRSPNLSIADGSSSCSPTKAAQATLQAHGSDLNLDDEEPRPNPPAISAWTTSTSPPSPASTKAPTTLSPSTTRLRSISTQIRFCSAKPNSAVRWPPAQHDHRQSRARPGCRPRPFAAR